MKPAIKKLISSIPSVDQLLRDPLGIDLQNKFGRKVITSRIRILTAQLQTEIIDGHLTALSKKDIYQRLEKMCFDYVPRVKTVFNLTGVVIHSNLGRSLYAEEAVEAGLKVMTNFTDIEYDLALGKRGERERFLINSIKELTWAEDATFVNNNAAAVFLVLNTFGMGKEVVIARGELVEIGGQFRIPEIMTQAGSVLREVGTTNRTHLHDFKAAINANTGLVMKVYTSNYEIVGFTKNVEESQIVELADKQNVPFVIDLGSGNLVNSLGADLLNEGTVRETIKKGVGLVTFSGDKLLGGPQCGIIAGKAKLIQRIRQNPVKRAMRIDKVTTAALSETLRIFMAERKTITQKVPTHRFLNRAVTDIQKLAEGLAKKASKMFNSVASVEVVECKSQVGSGALPIDLLPSFGIKITPINPPKLSVEELNELLRSLPSPVIGRINKQSIILDCRCLFDDGKLLEQFNYLERLIH